MLLLPHLMFSLVIFFNDCKLAFGHGAHTECWHDSLTLIGMYCAIVVCVCGGGWVGGCVCVGVCVCMCVGNGVSGWYSEEPGSLE